MIKNKVSLNDFCLDLSTRDKRVELIAAFHYSETRDRTLFDFQDAYQQRYEAFLTKPA